MDLQTIITTFILKYDFQPEIIKSVFWTIHGLIAMDIEDSDTLSNSKQY